MTQWYEKSSDLLEREKALMNSHYPQFTLENLDDGCLCWIGEIKSLINAGRKYALMVLYHPNHPFGKMGSSVNVYMLLPEGLNLYKNYLRPQDTPFGLCAQTCMDTIGEVYQSVCIDREECPMTAARQLSLYLAWLFVSECQTECNMRSLDWRSLTTIYPYLETIVKDLLYCKIMKEDTILGPFDISSCRSHLEERLCL